MDANVYSRKCLFKLINFINIHHPNKDVKFWPDLASPQRTLGAPHWDFICALLCRNVYDTVMGQNSPEGPGNEYKRRPENDEKNFTKIALHWGLRALISLKLRSDCNCIHHRKKIIKLSLILEKIYWVR